MLRARAGASHSSTFTSHSLSDAQRTMSTSSDLIAAVERLVKDHMAQ